MGRMQQFRVGRSERKYRRSISEVTGLGLFD